MISKKDLPQLMRFLIAGGVSTVVVYFPLLYALTEFAGVWYGVSAAIAAIVSNGLNFVLQKRWTFKNKDRGKTYDQAKLYILLKIGLTAIGWAALYVFVEYFGQPYFRTAIIIAIPISAISFLASRKIFKSKSPVP